MYNHMLIAHQHKSATTCTILLRLDPFASPAHALYAIGRFTEPGSDIWIPNDGKRSST